MALTVDTARSILVEVLCDVAPDLDPSDLDDDADLFDDLGLDSMDVLNVATGIYDRTGIEVPEVDYPRLVSIGGGADYLSGRASAD
ncbi:MAG: phosphopantetheine-binding protein [Actinomycetota bacterium]